MHSLLCTVSLFAAAVLAAPRSPAAKWRFELQKTPSGIVALESVVVSPSLVLMFDNAANAPMQINNHSAWGALWNLDTSTVRPINVITNSFCASGAFVSNGSMISIGGQPDVTSFFPNNPAPSGLMGIRIWEPCTDRTGLSCSLFEDPEHLKLARGRWYPTAIRIYDGSLFIAGGGKAFSTFVNGPGFPENTFEFYPPRDGGVPRPSQFLEDTLPSNFFPRAFSLPDGRIFMVAGNKTMIYDADTDTEERLPDIPNGVTVTNPADGSAILMPLSPPHYTPEVLVCGGQLFDTSIPAINQSSQHLASDQCSRIVVTKEGIKKGWQVEKLLEPRVMPELVHLPNGQILIANGGRTGFAAFGSVGDAVGASNADHPVFTPAIYTPDAKLGSRWSNKGMPSSTIPRLYHSTITLTPQGNFLVAGSNPNGNITEAANIKFKSEFRVEKLNPPYMFVDRPTIKSSPRKLWWGVTYTLSVKIPAGLDTKKLQVSLMDLGFSTHAFHSSARLVFMDAKLSRDKKTITFKAPPNGKVYPPGPAWVYVTVDDVSSEAVEVMMGSGRAPPTLV